MCCASYHLSQRRYVSHTNQFPQHTLSPPPLSFLPSLLSPLPSLPVPPQCCPQQPTLFRPRHSRRRSRRIIKQPSPPLPPSLSPFCMYYTLLCRCFVYYIGSLPFIYAHCTVYYLQSCRYSFVRDLFAYPFTKISSQLYSVFEFNV